MKWLLVIAVFGLISFGAHYAFAQAAGLKRVVQVSAGRAKFSAEVADTTLARAQGLSGHAPLGKDEGMIFIFPRPSSGSFWMYRMLFGLDLVWVYQGKVIGITPDVRPMSETGYRLYSPPAPYDLVFEIPSGSAKRHGVRVGDALSYR